MKLGPVSCKTVGWVASLVTIAAWALATPAPAGGGEFLLYQSGPWGFPPAGERVLADLGGVDLTVERAGGVDGAACAELFFEDRTATAGQDYVPVPQTLCWADQDGSPRHVKVPVLDDALFEGREEFVAALRNPAGAVLGAGARALLEIVDDEGILRFSTDRVDVSESDTALVSVERMASDAGVEGVTVELQFQDGTAVAGADFSATPVTVSWGPAEAGRTDVVLGLFGDAVPEPPEEFSVTLAGADDGLGDPFSLTVRVFDDDAVPPGGALVFGANRVAASESVGELAVAVHRVNGASGEVSVECFASAGSASPGRDFVFEPQRLEWADGDKTARFVRIAWVDDGDREGVETLVLSFRDLVGATLYSPSRVQIQVDDAEDAWAVPPPPVGEAANMFGGGFEDIGCFIGSLR